MDVIEKQTLTLGGARGETLCNTSQGSLTHERRFGRGRGGRVVITCDSMKSWSYMAQAYVGDIRRYTLGA